MKHLDLWNAYKELDNFEKEQLRAAVMAHGGKYVFLDVEKDYEEAGEEEPSMPCIMAGKKYSDAYEDYYVTQVVVEDGEHLILYGYPKEGYRSDEYVIDDVAHGGYGWIIDEIPETETVKDVSNVGSLLVKEFVYNLNHKNYESDL